MSVLVFATLGVLLYMAAKFTRPCEPNRADRIPPGALARFNRSLDEAADELEDELARTRDALELFGED